MNAPVQPPLQRRLWSRYEAIHSVCYFHPEFGAVLDRAGFHGGWNGYFAGRAAPLGPVTAPTVTALFFGFSPTMVERAVPKVWGRLEPSAIIDARFEAAESVIGGIASDVLADDELVRLTEELERSVDALSFDGRALGAAWAGVDRPDSWGARLWLAATQLREHRGDGHVIAAVAHGLDGLETNVTHIASGDVEGQALRDNRGWTDEDWKRAEGALVERGLVEDGRLTHMGRAVRTKVEGYTDDLAVRQIQAMNDLDWVMETLGRVGRAIIDEGALPVPNPIGVPRPS